MKLQFLSILTLIFITLKLIWFIDWNWFWVLSPLVVPSLTMIVIITTAMVSVSWKEYIKKVINKFSK